jgi:hypothetical protein
MSSPAPVRSVTTLVLSSQTPKNEHYADDLCRTRGREARYCSVAVVEREFGLFVERTSL